MTARRILILPLFPMLVCGLIPISKAQAQMPVARVVVTEAKTLDASATITLVGTVEPRRRSRVCAEIAGLVKEMPGREGDYVANGDVICQLNRDTLELRLAEEQGRLSSLKARHRELLAGTRKEDLARIRAILDEARAIYQRWTFEMKRIEKLYAGRDSNAKEYNDTQTEHLASERRQIAAQASYDLAVAGPRKEVIAQASHAVAQQQAVVDRISKDLEKTAVRAPFDGFLIARMAEIGEWIPVGNNVVEIAELSSVLVQIDVPESALPYLSVGQPARVTVDALKRSFEGKIRLIVRQADPNARTFPVAIMVDNKGGLLAAGMFTRATIPAGPKQESVAVPKDGIVEKEGTSYVAVVMPGRDGGHMGMLIPVTVGVDVGDWITVTSGNIRPGTQIITRGTERILPFPSPVEIVDLSGTPVAMPGRAKPPHSEDGA